jgi:putative tryptophan/tyrosine transport system substrate-binding protein
LVNRRVAVIVALQTPAVVAAKAATRDIPIVFAAGLDPVESGLVASLSRPGGNLTGITGLIAAVAAKRLELLHQLIPRAESVAYLVSPINGAFSELETREMRAAARALGLRLLVLNADRPREFEPAFATLVREGGGGLVVSGATFYSGYADEIVALAARYQVPTIYGRREDSVAGGLVSYGTDFPELYRQVGVYTGRILKGEKPADLPVQQVTKLVLTINLKTATALRLTIPEALLATADEVIE